ncbi:Hmo1 protein [Saccharomycopsis crataegensis]|uniref:Hmo1 protein n=1 Tax=Saccharomycopsis crataegensis TaxID=43959 RepID=A0AAV5QUZ8_9ASCO|nr:Hmo1 protein [Saccharomycopsis crataegensis]
MTKDLKEAKDSLVAALFELTKAAETAAKATVDFYNHAAAVDATIDTDFSKELVSAFESLTGSAINLKRSATELEETEEESVVTKKKKNVDPNAPKKPPSSYLAFSSYCRKVLGEKRPELNLPQLYSNDMTKAIAEKWKLLDDEEKAKWREQYDLQMVSYNKEKEDYSVAKAEGRDVNMSGINHSYIVETPIDPYLPEESDLRVKIEGKDEKKKEKKEKKKKKKKHVEASQEL